jgi:hypothetical protein
VAPPPGRIKLIDNRTRYMEVWQVRLRHLLASIKAIPGRYKMMPKKNLIPFLLPAVVIAFVASSLVVLFGYTPGTAAPFPYVPPPEGPEGYYIKANTGSIEVSFISNYFHPFDAYGYKGQSFIFNRVEITNWIESRSTDTYLATEMIQFVARDPSDLKKFKVGDKIDIIGICDGMLEEYPVIIAFTDCLFLPSGLASLPLPGGPAPITSGY